MFVVKAGLIMISFMVIRCSRCILITEFTARTDAIGKTGTTFILSTIDNGTPVSCALACKTNNYCMLFFYNKESRSCTLHNRNLTDIVMAPEAQSSCFMAHYEEAASWIVSVTKYSSETQYKARCIIGPRDWIPWKVPGSNPTDFIEVKIENDLYIESINIHEISYYCGFVKRISVLTPDGTWFLVWSTETVKKVRSRRTFSPQIKKTYFRTSSIRIDIVSTPPVESIDSVRVFGKKIRMYQNQQD